MVALCIGFHNTTLNLRSRSPLAHFELIYIYNRLTAVTYTQRRSRSIRSIFIPGGRGYLAAAASRFSLWWHGERRPPALTADTASGAGLQGGIEDDVPPCDGEANPASPECGDPRTDSNLVAQLSVPAVAQVGGLELALRVDKVKDALPLVVDWEDPPLADELQVVGLEAVRVLLLDLRLLAIPMGTLSICTSRFLGDRVISD